MHTGNLFMYMSWCLSTTQQAFILHTPDAHWASTALKIVGKKKL